MVSLRSRQLLFNLKMNGTARAAAFSPDGRDLLTMGALHSMTAAYPAEAHTHDEPTLLATLCGCFTGMQTSNARRTPTTKASGMITGNWQFQVAMVRMQAMNGCFRAKILVCLTGGDGTVYTWDLRTRRCRDRVVDEGTVKGTSLACGTTLFATGSDSGAVNLHARRLAGQLGRLTHHLQACV